MSITVSQTGVTPSKTFGSYDHWILQPNVIIPQCKILKPHTFTWSKYVKGVSSFDGAQKIAARFRINPSTIIARRFLVHLEQCTSTCIVRVCTDVGKLFTPVLVAFPFVYQPRSVPTIWETRETILDPSIARIWLVTLRLPKELQRAIGGSSMKLGKKSMNFGFCLFYAGITLEHS